MWDMFFKLLPKGDFEDLGIRLWASQKLKQLGEFFVCVLCKTIGMSPSYDNF